MEAEMNRVKQTGRKQNVNLRSDFRAELEALEQQLATLQKEVKIRSEELEEQRKQFEEQAKKQETEYERILKTANLNAEKEAQSIENSAKVEFDANMQTQLALVRSEQAEQIASIEADSDTERK